MTDWTDAKSGMIQSFRFTDEREVDGVSFGRLEIIWANGGKGAYLDVNRRTYEDFVAAESRGKFLNSVIKPGFRYERTQEKADEQRQEEAADGSERGQV